MTNPYLNLKKSTEGTDVNPYLKKEETFGAVVEQKKPTSFWDTVKQAATGIGKGVSTTFKALRHGATLQQALSDFAPIYALSDKEKAEINANAIKNKEETQRTFDNLKSGKITSISQEKSEELFGVIRKRTVEEKYEQAAHRATQETISSVPVLAASILAGGAIIPMILPSIERTIGAKLLQMGVSKVITGRTVVGLGNTIGQGLGGGSVGAITTPEDRLAGGKEQAAGFAAFGAVSTLPTPLRLAATIVLPGLMTKLAGGKDEEAIANSIVLSMFVATEMFRGRSYKPKTVQERVAQRNVAEVMARDIMNIKEGKLTTEAVESAYSRLVEKVGKDDIKAIAAKSAKDVLNQKVELQTKLEEGLVKPEEVKVVKKPVAKPVEKPIAKPIKEPVSTKVDKISKAAESIETKATEKGFSTHYEKIKGDLNAAFEDRIVIDRMDTKAELKKAYKYLQNPLPAVKQKALRAVMGMGEAPKGVNLQVLRMSMIESLKSAGKYEQARMVARELSMGFTETARDLNIAKLDLNNAGQRRIEGAISSERLMKIGKRIPEGIEKLPPREAATKKIKSEAKEKSMEVTKEMSKIKSADTLLKELIC